VRTRTPPGGCTGITGSALRDFHVRVYVETGSQLPPEESNIGDVNPTLYSVAMLQLLNDLTTDETFRTCANETCQRTFICQLGRSRYYNRAEGVRYCSRTCANQQTQRDYYRRKRAERNGR
jgi:predicted RNA-binding Zn ribbon-like protein